MPLINALINGNHYFILFIINVTTTHQYVSSFVSKSEREEKRSQASDVFGAMGVDGSRTPGWGSQCGNMGASARRNFSDQWFESKHMAINSRGWIVQLR